MKLHPISDDLVSSVLALNEAAVPHVNSLTEASLRQLIEKSFRCQVVIVEETVAGFLLALREGMAYDSLNYRWFSERYEQFAYVDRIVVHEAHRRSGVGRGLYHDLVLATAGCVPLIACEVNLRPPNPRSLEFHRDMGFREVGQQDTEGGEKRVCLMTRRVS